MQSFESSKMCSCSPMPNADYLPASSSYNTKEDVSSKYFREIGAEIVGNELIIRMERDKSKLKKHRNQWEPPCDCDTVQIQRPTSKEGPKIINGGDNNRILFRIHSRSRFNTKDDPTYKPQAISYTVGSCSGGENTNDQCRIITVHPQLGSPGSQEVHTDHVAENNQNVFLLRVKKKSDPTERKKRNIELELRTPRLPTPPPSKTVTQLQPLVKANIEKQREPVKQDSKVIKKKKKKKKK